MTQRAQTPHEWWKDKSDSTERAAFTQSYRSGQREQHAAGWRRNVMLGFLVIAIPVLVRLLIAT
ncbi:MULTISPECIES: hypothetical protein [unclassified Variovorax]|jgi:hypothetical protein|uniref:hypothetical protein n=1 Tax=unclassified Variovorax TaxID=663243 RepID=UPI002B22823C|nr:hypothetical protein [Variovorax sp. LG9.2]MEB0056314.1 hypothetical protein [Variovorax sp. LG9.2]